MRPAHREATARSTAAGLYLIDTLLADRYSRWRWTQNRNNDTIGRNRLAYPNRHYVIGVDLTPLKTGGSTIVAEVAKTLARLGRNSKPRRVRLPADAVLSFWLPSAGLGAHVGMPCNAQRRSPEAVNVDLHSRKSGRAVSPPGDP